MSDSRTIVVKGDYFEHVEGNVYIETVTIIRNGQQLRLPLQRPPRADHFTDRKEELAYLLKDLQQGRVVTLCGPGGIGKTALAAEAIWMLTRGDTLPEKFPDGVIWHNFYREPAADKALEHIALSFGEEPRPTPLDAALRALAGKKVLMLLDGTEDADNLQAVLDVRGECGVLVTSRRRKDAVAERHDMKPLEVDEAVKLLRAWGSEIAANTAAIEQICKLVGGLPLAVRLVGLYLRAEEETAAEYLEWLKETPLEALDPFNRQVDQGDRRQIESVPLLLKRSLEKVSKEARQALAVIGLLALAPFDREVIAVALKMSKTQIGRPLGELVNYGLLLRVKLHYEVSHALIHTYARQELAAPEGIIRKLGDYFVRFVQKHQRAYEKIDIMRPHILEILDRLVEQKILEPVIEITHILTRSRGEGYLQLRGFWNDENDCLRKAIDACELLMKDSDASQGAYWFHHLADLKFGLGDLLFHKDNYKEAAETFERSLDLYKQVDGCQEQLAETHLRLGEICLNRSEFDQALKHFESSLKIYKQLEKDEKTLAPIYLWLGRTFHDQKSYEEARSNYEESFVHYQNTEDMSESARVLILLGDLAFDQGEEEKAWGYLRQSEDLIKSSKEKSLAIARVRRELANRYLWKNTFEKAEQLHLLSLQDFETLDEKPEIAWSLQGLGDTYFGMRNYPNAEQTYQKALKYFKELGISHGKAYALDHLGMIKLKQNKAAEARKYFEEGLEQFIASGLKDGIGYLLFNLADAERAEGKWEEAINHYNKSLEIWEELGREDRISLTTERLEMAINKITDTEQ